MSEAQFKHPTLAEYINRNREWYQAWIKVSGVGSLRPWGEMEKELRQEHAMVEAMDTVKRQVYWFEKSKKNALVLSATKERLDRAIAAGKARDLAGTAIRDVKEQVAHARSGK